MRVYAIKSEIPLTNHNPSGLPMATTPRYPKAKGRKQLVFSNCLDYYADIFYRIASTNAYLFKASCVIAPFDQPSTLNTRAPLNHHESTKRCK